MKNSYTKDQIRLACKMSKVSEKKIEKVIQSLDIAVEEIEELFDCVTCKHGFMNPFDQYYCGKGYDLENGDDCLGDSYEIHIIL